LIGLLAFAAVSGAAEPPVRQVLILQSYDRGNLILDTFTGNFRIDLERRAGGPVNFVQVVVGPTGFVSAAEQSVVDYIRSTFAGRPRPDLIVAVAGPASVFVRKYRQQLFPDAPLLFASVDQRYLGEAPLAGNEAAVAVLNDFPAIVDDILHVLPQTGQVFMIVGYGPVREFWRHRLEEEFSRFRGRVKFVWSDDLSFPEMLRRSSSLPPHSAIYFLTLGADATGAAYADERALAELRASANAPLFAAHSVYLGSGIVGGRLLSIDELSTRTADAAYRILNGASPGSVTTPPQLQGRPVFDWRELKRWNIPETRLPAGSLVKFRGPTLWSEYRGAALTAAAALIIQALLIIGLLFERRARRKAENESRKNLSLAADVNRRETMSALTSSISHELGQPLGAMMRNAEALQLMIDNSSATPENIDEVLSDIHADGVRAAQIMERHRTMLRSRQLQKRQVDLQTLVEEVLALVSHHMSTRQVRLTVNVPAESCAVSGDAVLLQQVFVNLVMNAMDAMAQLPGQRHIMIGVEVVRGNAEISVRDSGPGLPEDSAARLFTPFVTTKPHGLGIGLAIARSIVEAHRGSIVARNHPAGGAVFTVTLRVSQAHESVPGGPIHNSHPGHPRLP
jgi:signal transduction histidine kinase